MGGKNQQGCCSSFRSSHVPAIRTIASSILDTAGDWSFFVSFVNRDGLNTGDLKESLNASGLEESFATFTNENKAEVPLLLASCLIGTIITVILVIRFIMKGCVSSYFKDDTICVRSLKNQKCFLIMELILEDIPQIVLTILVKGEGALHDPVAVFNLTTSLYNSLFDILEILEVEKNNNDEDDVENKETKSSA